MDYLILSVSWIVFCALHSALISITAKEYFKRELKEGFIYYRLFYNIFSLVTITPVLLYTKSVTGTPLFQWDGYLFIIQLFLNLTGAVIVLLAVKEYDMLLFAGFRQVMTGSDQHVPGESPHIKDTGILGVIRHPFYSAVFLFLWGRDMSAADLVVNVILSCYLVIGTILEERKLVIEFGNGYIVYKKRVPMYIPFT